MVDDRTPPHDDAAERAVLGACMLSPAALKQTNERLVSSHFYKPEHELLHDAFLALSKNQRPVDPVTVNAYLQERGTLNRVGGAGYLHSLIADTPVAANADYWAAIVADRARRRQAITCTTAAITELYSSEDTAEDVIDRTADTITRLRYADTGDTDTVLTLDEFCDQTLPAEDWVVEGLLSRGDRLVLTGIEGLGKSTLMRQVAVCAAAGIQPFTLRPQPAQTVLVVDAENPARIMIRRFNDLRTAAHRRGMTIPTGRLWIDRRPDGLDLAETRDRRWLTRRVETINPDLLVIGPAYKLYIGGDNKREEDLARQVTSVLDAIREQTGCALVLEHHSPHAAPTTRQRPVRPIGSSLWLRWPEFGYGIRLADHPDAHTRRIVDWVSWRGPRDDRTWPDRLEAGTDGWPWVESQPAATRWTA